MRALVAGDCGIYGEVVITGGDIAQHDAVEIL